MTHSPTFSRTTTHLLCPAAAGAKYLRARVWGTPVVDMRWLAHIAKTGALPTTGMFLVPTPHAPDVETSDVINCTRCIPLLTSCSRSRSKAKLLDLAQEGLAAASPQNVPATFLLPLENTQPDADFANQEVSFGRPKLLPSQDEVVPSSSPSSPPPSSPASTSHLPPSSLSAHPSLVLSSHSSGNTPAPSSNADDDESVLRVPSSNTPSPLKLPPSPTDPAARALHESISNLLGKRNAGAMAIEDHAEPPQRRKRARPRPKIPPALRPDSAGADVDVNVNTNVGSRGSGAHLVAANIYSTSYAFGDEPESGIPATPDDGMSSRLQAVYEDPTQAAERRKLISLLNGAPGQSRVREERAHRTAALASSNVRPSGRMAGF